MRTAALLFLVSCAGQSAIRPDVARIGDARMWSVANAESHVVPEDGKQVLRLAPVGGNRKGSNVGMALVAGVTCTEGTIDVDLRGRGEESASFVGIAFGVADANRYEAIYFRPFRFRSADAVERSHAVQYIAWPEHTWEALRAQAPGLYEAAIAPAPDPAGWFHARIEVGRATVKVFVDGAAQPTLAVNRLRTASGRVGLWVDSQEGSFAALVLGGCGRARHLDKRGGVDDGRRQAHARVRGTLTYFNAASHQDLDTYLWACPDPRSARSGDDSCEDEPYKRMTARPQVSAKLAALDFIQRGLRGGDRDDAHPGG